MSQHPYYPQSIEVPGFVPGTFSVAKIFTIFGVSVASVFVLTWLASGRCRVRTIDRWIMCWWAITGAIHLIIEGTFVAFPSLYKTSAAETNFLFEVWKEYAKGDSRYATHDSFVVSMEAVTAFLEGPLSFLAVYAIATKKPYRFVLQLAVSLGQLYGDVLYFATCFLEGFVHAAPGALYFWVYFVAMNAIWIVIPFLIAARAWRHSCRTIVGTEAHSKTH